MNRGSRYAALLLFSAAILYLSNSPRLAAQQNPSQNSAATPGEVSEGSRFLVALNEKVSTGDDKAGKTFSAKTLEPIVANDGAVLPAGAEIRGHISRVESAQVVGRARIWLTFDDIRTSGGRAPLVAEVADVPGEHSVITGQEGQIEGATSHSTQDAEAAAAGAALGAVAGAKAGGKKGAAAGAGVGAVTAFLVSSGFGQEVELQKETKLELVLYRPLYLRQ